MWTVLHETATALPSRYKRFRPCAVNVDGALSTGPGRISSRRRFAYRAVFTLPELLAGAGLPVLFTDEALKRLVDRGTVARSLAGGTETYELIGPQA